VASEVAKAFVTISGEDAPLKAVLGNLKNLMVNPVTQAADLARAALTRSLSGLGKSATDLLSGNLSAVLSGNLGHSIEEIGTTLSDALGGAIKGGSEVVGNLAGSVIETLGGLTADAVHLVGDAAGKILKQAGDAAKWVGSQMGTAIKSVAGSVGDVLNFIPIVGPFLGGAVKMVGSVVAKGVELVGDVIGNTLSVLGGMVTKIGDLAAGAIKGVTDLAAGLARTIIPLAGGMIGGLIEKVGGGISSGVGETINAIMNPVKQAMGNSLKDLDLWIDRAIVMEAEAARLENSLKLTGNAAGFTAEELKKMAKSSIGGGGMFGNEEALKAMTILSGPGGPQGDMLIRASKAAQDLAAKMGGDLPGAANTLMHALTNPEVGVRQLRRALMLTHEETLGMKQAMEQIPDTAGKMAYMLGIVEKRTLGMADALGATTQGKLMKLRSAWMSIGDGIGEVLEPLTGIVASVANVIVGIFAGGVNPTLAEFAETTKGWAKSVDEFLTNNKETFQLWGGIVKDIFANIGELIREGFGALFGNLDGGKAQSFWDTFKQGVTDALRVMKQLTSSWETMQDVGGIAWDFIKEQAMETWKSITSFITNSWNEITGAMEDESIWDTVKNKGMNLWESLKSSGMEFVTTVVDYLKEQMKEAFSIIGEELDNLGKKLLSKAGGKLSLGLNTPNAQGTHTRTTKVNAPAPEAAGDQGAPAAGVNVPAPAEEIMEGPAEEAAEETAAQRFARRLREALHGAQANPWDFGPDEKDLKDWQNRQGKGFGPQAMQAKFTGLEDFAKQLQESIMPGAQNELPDIAKKIQEGGEKAVAVLEQIRDKPNAPATYAA
jgi:hypothetical protein